MNMTFKPVILLAMMLISASCVSSEKSGEADAYSNTEVQNRGVGKDQWWSALPRAAWTRLERVRMSADQAWFEVYRIFPGVYAIYEPGQFEEVISYLITGRNQAVLFDTGLGIGDISRVVKDLTHLPVLVLNSHSHYDHIGGNYQFEQILTTNTAYSKLRTAGIEHDEVSEFVGEGWIWKQTPGNFEPADYAIRPFSVIDTVTDGQVIRLGGRSLEVLLTPGHAPDSLCLYDRQNGLLFTGDTFYPAPLYTHLPGSDFAQYRESAQRLARLRAGVRHLLPAHNVPLADAEYLTRMARAFDEITGGAANYVIADDLREYEFDGFSIIVNPAMTELPD